MVPPHACGAVAGASRGPRRSALAAASAAQQQEVVRCLALITTCWGRSPHRAEQAALLAQWADYGRVRQLWRQDVDGRGLDPVCCLITQPLLCSAA